MAREIVALLCLALACGGTPTEPAASRGTPQDGGAPMPDAGSPPADGGSSVPDAGHAPDGGPDGGSSVPDAGHAPDGGPDGGSSVPDGGPAPDDGPRLAIAPAAASVPAGLRQQFIATVTGSADTAVLWSVQEGAAGGSVDASGMYLAPAAAGVYHVVATSSADPTRFAAATATVTPARADHPPRLAMAAFDSTLPVPELSLDAAGAGSSRVGKISIRASEGTVEVDGRALPSIVFERQPLAAEARINAYEVVSVAPDRIYLLWIYCRTTSQVITQAWLESTAGEGLFSENASGSCADVVAASNPRLRAPDVSMDWPAAARGFSVSGTGIDLPSRAPGTVLYEGVTQVVFHFATVDCSFCATSGWYELHSLLWNPRTQAITFGIFYLMAGAGPVLFQYTLSMPVLARGVHASYAATWSREPSVSAASKRMTMPWGPTPWGITPVPPSVR